MSIFKIRAHHALCMNFYEGKGYDSAFVSNMTDIQQKLAQNPRIQIISECDQICSTCPNNKHVAVCIENTIDASQATDSCITYDKVKNYDNAVLSLCHLHADTEICWLDLQALVKERIFDTGMFDSICGDCGWSELCHHR